MAVGQKHGSREYVELTTTRPVPPSGIPCQTPLPGSPHSRSRLAHGAAPSDRRLDMVREMRRHLAWAAQHAAPSRAAQHATPPPGMPPRHLACRPAARRAARFSLLLQGTAAVPNGQHASWPGRARPAVWQFAPDSQVAIRGFATGRKIAPRIPCAPYRRVSTRDARGGSMASSNINCWRTGGSGFVRRFHSGDPSGYLQKTVYQQ